MTGTEGFNQDNPLNRQNEEVYPYLIENKATVLFEYQVSPNTPFINLETTSNLVITCPRLLNLNISESVEKEEVLVGECLCYKVEIVNAGNIQVENICFSTMIPRKACFILGSVTFNGVGKKYLDPTKGFRIKKIDACEHMEITFCVCVLGVPLGSKLYNQIQFKYDYKVDCNDIPITTTVFSNRVETIVRAVKCSVLKKVNKEYVQVSDELAYEVMIKNTGNVELKEIYFIDSLLETIQFIPHTVYIDGVCYTNYNPCQGFFLKNIKAKESCIVTFCVKVIALPKDLSIGNASSINFSYQLTQQIPVVREYVCSNIPITYVMEGRIEVTKEVDKHWAMVGNELTYTFIICNTGNTDVFQVHLIDLLPRTVYYKKNSLIINGRREDYLYNPNQGILLGILQEKEQVIVQFSVIVGCLVEDYKLTNQAEVNYQYYWNPKVVQIEAQAISNRVTTTIQGRNTLEENHSILQAVDDVSQIANLQVIKEVDLKYATLNDIISYTIRIFNKGTITAKKVNFRDIMPKEVAFIKESVCINGEIKRGYNPYNSFMIGEIEPRQMMEVSFKSRIEEIPVSESIEDEAIVTFAYYDQVMGKDIYQEVESNRVTVQIHYENLIVIKQVDRRYSTSGDIITYSYVLENKGNVELAQLTLTDALQEEVNFVRGSVCIDEKVTCYDPRQGIPLAKILPMHRMHVEFEVQVIRELRIGILLNSALVHFKYKIAPYGNFYIKNIHSNTVCTFLALPRIKAQKGVDNEYGTIQDKMKYTIWIMNEGNRSIQRAFFKDCLTRELRFIEESVRIDDSIQKELNPLIGFNLPTIEIGNVIKIEFEAQVMALPNTMCFIKNDASVTGQYQVSPWGEYYEVTTMTNPVTTQVREGAISIVTGVDLQYAQVGDHLTYTILVAQRGNVAIQDLCFFDKLDRALEFVPKSVLIDGIAYIDLDPTIGFWLGRLTKTQQVKIQFRTKVKGLPVDECLKSQGIVTFNYQVNPNSINIYKTSMSSEAVTYIILGALRMIQQVDKILATVGEVITYNVQVTNTGNVEATHVYFRETLSEDITVKEDSVEVIEEGIKILYPSDLTKGFWLNDIAVGKTVTIIFQAIVVRKPFENRVINQAELQFSYEAYPNRSMVCKTIYSNKSITHIIMGEIEMIKQVNKAVAMIGENLTYTISLINTGNTNVAQVYFLDVIPDHAAFVSESVYVNGIYCPQYHPEIGFEIGTMVPGEIVKIMYQAYIIG